MTQRRRRLFVVSALVFAFGALGVLESYIVPLDRAEIGFVLTDSRITGEATSERLNRAILEIFSDEELATCFAEELVAELDGDPGAKEWLRRFLDRQGIEIEAADRSAESNALRKYLVTDVAANLGRRMQGRPARARADYLLYSPQRSHVNLYLGFGGEAWLPVLSEATARAFNQAAEKLEETRFDRWQSQVSSFQELLAARMRFLSEQIESLGVESEKIRDRLLTEIAAAETDSKRLLEELASWLRADADREAASYLGWMARLRAAHRIPSPVLEDLSALRANRRMQELLVGTDWLDAAAFGPRSRKESRGALTLWYVPRIPEEQIPYSQERAIRLGGELLPHRWAAPVGGSLIGLCLAFAFFALQEGIRAWRGQEVSR